jgi:hypothetical protein
MRMCDAFAGSIAIHAIARFAATGTEPATTVQWAPSSLVR